MVDIFHMIPMLSLVEMQDYSGKYTLELIPCTVLPNQGYTILTPLPCTAQQPIRFVVELCSGNIIETSHLLFLHYLVIPLKVLFIL